jgi:hypothetical protein
VTTVDDQRPHFQLRRGSHAAWSLKNPVLAVAEPIYVTDTKQWKLGDGVSRYLDLPFRDLPPDESGISQLEFQTHIDSEDPHPNYDDGRSLVVYYENAKV